MIIENNNQAFKQPVLVYDRIDQNQRATFFLIIFFSLLILPVLVFLVVYGMVWLGMLSMSVLQQVQDEQIFRVMYFLGGTVFFLLVLIAIIKYRSAVDSTLHTVGARPSLPEELNFVRTVENLCIGAGLPMPKLYVIDNWIPNAFCVGFSPDQASLVVTKGLLNLLDRLELEGVIAHELSHIGNRDSQLNTALTVLLRTIILPLPIQLILWIGLVFSLPMLLTGQDFFLDWPAEFRIYIIIETLLVIWTLLWPLIGRLIQRTVSRKREFLADADAVLLTRHPDGLARALVKISSAIQNNNKLMVKQNSVLTAPALSHLFLITPVTTISILDSHPSVKLRVELLVRMGAGIDTSHLEKAAISGAKYAQTGDTVTSAEQRNQEEFVSKDQLPLLVMATLHGIKYGFFSMLGFLFFTAILVMIMNAEVSSSVISGSIMIASSVGYAIAGYTGAKFYAPGRRLILFLTCGVLYLLWMLMSLSIYHLIYDSDTTGFLYDLVLQIIGGIILVIVGGIFGVLSQFLFVSGIVRYLFLSNSHSRIKPEHQSRHPSFEHGDHHINTDLKSDLGIDKNEWVKEFTIENSSENHTRTDTSDSNRMKHHGPSIPSPEHRIKCSNCGVVMADTDVMCVWCGHRRSN